MKMGFKSFASILAGMGLIGFSVGFILGYYFYAEFQTNPHEIHCVTNVPLRRSHLRAVMMLSLIHI